jgi:hypothetical protein
VVVTLLAVFSLSWLGQTVTAQPDPDVILRHVNPDGSDYTGNPFCPQTVWSADGSARVVSVVDWHDCNNAVGQNHLIRTEGYELIADDDGDGNPRAGYPAVGAPETLCDGLDDDDDGYVDDGTCIYPETPPDECNGVDDDGDGVVDDGQCIDEDPVDGIDNDGDTLVDEDPPNIASWTLMNAGANAAIVDGPNFCWTEDEAYARPNFNPENWNEQCIVIRSTMPGETIITASYNVPSAIPPIVGEITNALIKEWDSLIDTVILKAPDVESVTVPGMGGQLLPKDADGDGNRDAADEHLMDHNGETQEHSVIFDEALKRNRSAEGPIQLIESVHGQHVDFPDHPTEGAVVLAFIDSPRGCTYFADPTGQANFGTAMVGITDWRGFFVGPQIWPSGAQFTAEALAEAAAHSLTPGMSNNGLYPYALDDLLGVYVDTLCEEQATITLKVGYPSFVQSVPEIPAPEQVTINWTTVEMAKQPLIRWAGEEIVLEKRWALPDDWFPNGDANGDTVITDPEDVCPLVSVYDTDGDGHVDWDDLVALGLVVEGDTVILNHWVMYSRLDPSPGGLVGGYYDDDDGYLDSLNPDGAPDNAWADIDKQCHSKALYVSEEEGQVDVEAKLIESRNTCASGWFEGAGGYPACDGPASYEENLINKHAFLVWYLRIYQVKLTNLEGARSHHNAGTWWPEPIDPGTDTEADTLNVSADTLLRVRVKGWFRGGNLSGRGDTCLDIDGDGDEAGSEAGAPYPAGPDGCADPDDESLAGGFWVLPDDLVALAGPDPMSRIPTWDVMDDPGDDTSGYPANVIGLKSTLDSHDSVLRPNVPCIDPFCPRKTVVPDGELTVADAIMPPLKIRARIADPADAGFLKEADKVDDLGLDNAYSSIMVPSAPEIPPFVSNGGYDWDSWACRLQHIRDAATCPPSNLGLAQGPYEFFDVLNVLAAPGPLANTGIGNQSGQSEADPLHPRVIQFYTDNRGQGFFFANGDYNLSFDGCRIDVLSGTPDCSPGDIVGGSSVSVIGDYPYFRKHPAVQSNSVEETWTWGGFKTLTAERIDNTHTAIIAHLKDRDGFCKWDVGADPTVDGVTFSPSEHPVQGEEIEFRLNTQVGLIRDVSSHALYSAPHVPLGEATVAGLEGGVITDLRQALPLAEDVRVLGFYGEAKSVNETYVDPANPDECQAWIVIEHPADEDPDVSVVFHDPEGNIDRHWPESTYLSVLVPGWNDSCYTGPEVNIEEALTDAGLIEEDGTSHVLAAYRFTNDETQSFDRWFPGRPDIEDTLTTISPFDQLFILTDAGADWLMEITMPPTSATLVEGWNSVCYAGAPKSPDEATASIQGDFSVMYTVASDQLWRRYVPDYPWATNIVTLNQFTSVSILVTAMGGATWTFDPPALSTARSAAPPGASAGLEALPTTPGTVSAGEMCAPVFPGTYLGTVTINGLPAPDETVVHASIGGIEWATAVTSSGRYVVDVPQTMPVSPPCFAGGWLWFQADGAWCEPSVQWSSGLHDLNLQCGELATRVRIGSGQAPPGGQVTLPLDALDVPPVGLGAFTVDIAYEAGVVTPTGYVGDPDSRFDTVLCNLNYGPDTVRCTGIRATSDAVGDLMLAEITFEVEPDAPLSHQSPLALTVVTFADTEGYDIPHATEGGSIRVGLVGNVDCDQDVDAVDALFILQYVVGLRSVSNQCPLPSGTLYLPAADAQCDNDVDAVDALFVLQHVVGLRPSLECQAPLDISGSWLMYITPEGGAETEPDCSFIHQEWWGIYYLDWRRVYGVSVQGTITDHTLELSGQGTYYGDAINFSASATADGNTITGTYAYTGAFSESGTWRAERAECKKAKGWVRTVNIQDQGYTLDFDVWDLSPEGITFTSASVTGPLIGTMSLCSGGPTEYDPWTRCEAGPFPVQTVPTPGDVYTFAVHYSDGTSETVTAPVRETFVGFPAPVSPSDGQVVDTLTPVFSWQPPSCECQGYYRVWVVDSQGNDMWSVYLPKEATSVTYNFDGTGMPLVDGGTYEWRLIAFDEPISGGPDNNAWVLRSITVQIGAP